MSHLLIENAPRSNLIWKAIEDSEVYIEEDSLEKLTQYQDSTSSRKEIIDSLTIYYSEKGQNYLDMLYYASADTNYSFEEVMDSLENETYLTFRMLLGNLYMANNQYSDARSLYDSLKVYFNEDKDLLELREIQLDLFEDTLTYFDTDSAALETLESIAFGDTSVAAYQAKVILELINDTTFPRPYEDIEEGSPKRELDELVKEYEGDTTDAVRTLNYKLIPTLIAGEMYGMITLGNGETGELFIYSIYGKEEGKYRLTEGTNKIPLNSLNLVQGIYLYKVSANGEVKNKDKIVKVR